MSVRVFDSVLSVTQIPINMYQLVILTIYWIFHKIHNRMYKLEASNIIQLTNGAYNINQLFKIERKIIRLLNFDFNVQDPMLFVTYYCKYLNMKTDVSIRKNILYISLFEAFTVI